jgi:hypothetical protein
MVFSRGFVEPDNRGFIPPCIPTRAAKPPAGPGWVHEIKHDGYRLQVRREGDAVRLFTAAAMTGPADIPRSRAPRRSSGRGRSPSMARWPSATRTALPCSTPYTGTAPCARLSCRLSTSSKPTARIFGRWRSAPARRAWPRLARWERIRRRRSGLRDDGLHRDQRCEEKSKSKGNGTHSIHLRPPGRRDARSHSKRLCEVGQNTFFGSRT